MSKRAHYFLVGRPTTQPANEADEEIIDSSSFERIMLRRSVKGVKGFYPESLRVVKGFKHWTWLEIQEEKNP